MKTKTTKIKKRNNNKIHMSTCQKKIQEGHSIESLIYREPSDTAPGSQLSRISTQSHSIYNSVLSGFEVLGMIDFEFSPAKIGRNPVSKHQIQPEYGDGQADTGLENRTRLARPNP